MAYYHGLFVIGSRKLERSGATIQKWFISSILDSISGLNFLLDLREKNQIEREKLEKFDFEENDKIFYIIPKFKEGIENLDNNNCFLWYDGTKFCMFK